MGDLLEVAELLGADRSAVVAVGDLDQRPEGVVGLGGDAHGRSLSDRSDYPTGQRGVRAEQREFPPASREVVLRHTRARNACARPAGHRYCLLPVSSSPCWPCPERREGGSVSHYKSNIRDIEFNLFEVLGRDEVLGTGPFESIDPETARSILTEVERLAREDLAASYEDSDRNPPVFDPETHTAPLPESFKKSYQAWHDAEYWRLQLPEELGGTPAPSSLIWALGELVLGANAPIWMYGAGPGFAGIVHRNGNDRDKQIAQHIVDKGWNTTMVLTEPDAGSDVGAGSRQGHAERRRLLEHHRRQAVHHLRRERPVRQHHPPRPRPPAGRRGRRRPGHQGPEPVHRAEVPLRLRDRRADRRAQRRLRHQRRAQDGDQGLQHLRAHLRRLRRRRRRAGQGLAARRGPRRHRADVPGHRERPDDGGQQGDRHPVHRLPERAGVRQDPRAGLRPQPGRGQDRARA